MNRTRVWPWQAFGPSMLLPYYISNRHQSLSGNRSLNVGIPSRTPTLWHAEKKAPGTRPTPPSRRNSAHLQRVTQLCDSQASAHSSLTWPTRNNGSQRLDPQVLCALGAMGAPYRKGEGAGAGVGVGGCWRGWWMGKVWRKRDTGAAGAEFVRPATSY